MITVIKLLKYEQRGQGRGGMARNVRGSNQGTRLGFHSGVAQSKGGRKGRVI